MRLVKGIWGRLRPVLERPSDDLYSEVKTFPGWCHAMDSVWLVSTNRSCDGVYDKVKTHIDDNDWLLVNSLSSYRQGWLKKSV